MDGVESVLFAFTNFLHDLQQKELNPKAIVKIGIRHRHNLGQRSNFDPQKRHIYNFSNQLLETVYATCVIKQEFYCIFQLYVKIKDLHSAAMNTSTRGTSPNAVSCSTLRMHEVLGSILNSKWFIQKLKEQESRAPHPYNVVDVRSHKFRIMKIQIMSTKMQLRTHGLTPWRCKKQNIHTHHFQGIMKIQMLYFIQIFQF